MHLNPRKRLLVSRLLITQLLIACFVSILFLFKDLVSAYSALVGALACFIPNLYFVYRAFKYSGARSAKKILRSFYAGESIKILLTAVLFALIFVLVKPINVLAVFVGFIAVQSTSWLTPWLTLRRNG